MAQLAGKGYEATFPCPVSITPFAGLVAHPATLSALWFRGFLRFASTPFSKNVIGRHINTCLTALFRDGLGETSKNLETSFLPPRFACHADDLPFRAMDAVVRDLLDTTSTDYRPGISEQVPAEAPG